MRDETLSRRCDEGRKPHLRFSEENLGIVTGEIQCQNRPRWVVLIKVNVRH